MLGEKGRVVDDKEREEHMVDKELEGGGIEVT